MKKLIIFILITAICCSYVLGCKPKTNSEGNSTSESESLTESEKESVSESEKDSVSESQSESEEENTPTVSTVPEEVTDKKIISQLLAYDFNFFDPAPGSNVSVGYIVDNSLGYLSKFDTFLTEYLPIYEDYYFVYLKESLISSYATYLKENEEILKSNSSNVTWGNVEDENIINGKYLLAHRVLKGSNEDVKVYKCNDLQKISLKKDGYQMVFCSKIKPAIIKKNLSTKEALNNKIYIYEMTKLNYLAQENKFEFLSNKFFGTSISTSFVGEQLELLLTEYGKAECYYLGTESAYNGDRIIPTVKVAEVDGKKCVKLPRYYCRYNEEKGLSEWIDVLDEKIDLYEIYFIPHMNLAMFTPHKEKLRDAYICDVEGSESNSCRRGLYDFDKVCEIIR